MMVKGFKELFEKEKNNYTNISKIYNLFTKEGLKVVIFLGKPASSLAQRLKAICAPYRLRSADITL